MAPVDLSAFLDEIERLCRKLGIMIEVGEDQRVYCLGVKFATPAAAHASVTWPEGETPVFRYLMRRALSMEEKSYGPEHPNVAISLNNLAQLLRATNRLLLDGLPKGSHAYFARAGSRIAPAAKRPSLKQLQLVGRL